MQTPHKSCDQIEDYAATCLFVALACLTGGFVAAFLLVFPFSFAANSCLTVEEMESTSIL